MIRQKAKLGRRYAKYYNWCAKFGLLHQGRNGQHPRYIQYKSRQNVHNLKQIATVWGTPHTPALLIAREFLKNHLKQDEEYQMQLKQKYHQQFVDETNKMIKDRRFDPDVILRRAISGVLAGQTVRSSLATRKAVNILPLTSINIV